MPIVNVDFKALEWRTMAELSEDPTAIREISEGLDFHTDNQKRFNLPSRLIAKVFLFRWIYLGSAYSYAKDPDFASVSTSQEFWQDIIDQFNDKYSGIAQWHKDRVNECYKTGQVVSPFTGRVYRFEPKEVRGDLKYNVSEVVNLPNQGLGADIVALTRTEVFKRIRGSKEILPILTVHDSLTFDCAWSYREAWDGSRIVPWYEAYEIVKEVVQELPDLWERKYGHRLIVPHDVEAEVGVNYKWLHKIK